MAEPLTGYKLPSMQEYLDIRRSIHHEDFGKYIEVFAKNYQYWISDSNVMCLGSDMEFYSGLRLVTHNDSAMVTYKNIKYPAMLIKRTMHGYHMLIPHDKSLTWNEAAAMGKEVCVPYEEYDVKVIYNKDVDEVSDVTIFAVITGLFIGAVLAVYTYFT